MPTPATATVVVRDAAGQIVAVGDTIAISESSGYATTQVLATVTDLGREDTHVPGLVHPVARYAIDDRYYFVRSERMVRVQTASEREGFDALREAAIATIGELSPGAGPDLAEIVDALAGAVAATPGRAV